MSDCEVCRGARFIRLPVYRPLMVSALDGPPSIEPSPYREYPCPECSTGDNVSFERLRVVKFAKDYPDYLATNEIFIERLRHGMARELVRGMIEHGMIRFEQDKPDGMGTFRTRATVGVVAPGSVAKFEERVTERQMEMAAAMVDQAESDISIWGSYYGVDLIKKSQAIAWLREAYQKVSAKYARK